MKIGCCVKIEQIPFVKESGFDFVELSAMELAALSEEAFLQLQQTLHRLQMPVLALNMYCNESVFDVNTPVNPQPIRAYAQLVCSRAAAIGVSLIGIGCPACRKRADQTASHIALERFLNFCRITHETASAYAIRILVEPVHHRLCNVINTVQEGLEAIAALQNDKIQLLVDFCHAKIMMEADEDLAAALARAAHVHVGHMDMETGRRDFLRARDAADCVHIAALLKAADYQGNISMEASGPGDLLEGLRGSCDILRRTLSDAAAYHGVSC